MTLQSTPSYSLKTWRATDRIHTRSSKRIICTTKEKMFHFILFVGFLCFSVGESSSTGKWLIKLLQLLKMTKILKTFRSLPFQQAYWLFTKECFMINMKYCPFHLYIQSKILFRLINNGVCVFNGTHRCSYNHRIDIIHIRKLDNDFWAINTAAWYSSIFC